MARKAVLIGLNYPGTDSELKGCVTDVERMYECLVNRYGFSEEDITLLIDTDDSYTQPTAKNIRRALSSLVESAEPGDILFVHYSGHGCRVPIHTDDDYDSTGYDECIVCCDSNLITDDEITEFIERLPEDCRLTFVSDSCHSGGLIDETKEQIGNSTKHNPRHNIVEEEDEEDEEGEQEEYEEEDQEDEQEAEEEDQEDEQEDEEEDQEDEQEDQEEDQEDEQEDQEEEVDDDDDDYNDYKEPKINSNIVKMNRSLPLSKLIEIMKQKTGKKDIDVGNIRSTLYDVFGEDVSPKLNKYMNSDKTSSYANYNNNYGVTSSKRGLPEGGILISGCQTDQTSEDVPNPENPDESYGALSNAIQTILSAYDSDITNRELVLKVRALLKSDGYKQKPGLYCTDYYADAPFLC